MPGPKMRMLKRQDSHRSRVSRSSVKCVGLFKQLHVLRHIVATLLQGLWIPFTALGSKEVAAVDMNGAGQSGDWISHRVNDVITYYRSTEIMTDCFSAKSEGLPE